MLVRVLYADAPQAGSLDTKAFDHNVRQESVAPNIAPKLAGPVYLRALAGAWFGSYSQKRRAAFDAILKAGGQIQMSIGEPSLLEEWFGAEAFGSVNKVWISCRTSRTSIYPRTAP